MPVIPAAWRQMWEDVEDVNTILCYIASSRLTSIKPCLKN